MLAILANAGAVNKHLMQQALLLASQLRLGVESTCMCEADRYVLLEKINPLEHRVLAGGERMLFRLCWFESNYIRKIIKIILRRTIVSMSPTFIVILYHNVNDTQT